MMGIMESAIMMEQDMMNHDGFKHDRSHGFWNESTNDTSINKIILHL